LLKETQERKMIRKALLFILFIAASGCSKPIVFNETTYFEDLIWNRFNHVIHDFTIEDLSTTYDLKVKFTHTDSYSSDHISMNITLYFPGGGMRSRDYDFRLQDNQLKWLGEEKGGLFSNEFLVISGVRFPEAGVSQIRVENKMTKFNTLGVASVGVVVEKTKVK
jgi:gliding motility-associated lipoprotein GldH